MATDKQQTTSSTDQHAAQSSAPRSSTTQVGQVMQELGRLTQRLPTTRYRRLQPRARSGPPPSREQLAGLIGALGDPQHPDHAGAVDALVEIGPAAVLALNEALDPRLSWLTAYRAAEALGRIGDGRATGPLIQALRHSNSNVRWNAVHALSQVGDVRAIFELRRLAQDDHGRTSWGESVAGAAQSTLDQIQAKGVWGQGIELVKTAITCVLMILSLILAFSVVTTLRSELDQVGQVPPGVVAPNLRTPLPSATDEAAAPGVSVPVSEPEPTTPPETPTVVSGPPVSGTVLLTANVRPFPSINNQPIGQVRQNDEIIFLARTADGQWYRIRLGERFSNTSSINNPDGSATGWVNNALLSEPEGLVSVEEVSVPTNTPDPNEVPNP